MAGWSVAACGQSHASDAPAAQRDEVVHGEPSPEGSFEDGVLLLRTTLDGDDLICSASLVAENLVLTARHCVSYLGRGIFSCTAQGELVSLDPGAGELGTHLEASSIEFYSAATPRTEPMAYGKEVLSTLSDTICMNDLAFVVLDRNLELPVLPLRLAGQAERGEPVTLVGYGLDDAMSRTGKLDVETQPRTRNAELVVADIGPLETGQQISTVPPRSLLVEGPAGCLGDSGGPLLARETGAVLGVYSLLGGESCLGADARHLFAHVPLFPLLADQAFDAAGSEPRPEPSVEPSGEGGASGNGATASGGTSANEAGEGGGASLAAAGAGGVLAKGGASNGDAGSETGMNGGAADAPETPPRTGPPRGPKDDGCAIAPHPGRDDSLGLVLFALATCLGRSRRRAISRR